MSDLNEQTFTDLLSPVPPQEFFTQISEERIIHELNMQDLINVCAFRDRVKDRHAEGIKPDAFADSPLPRQLSASMLEHLLPHLYHTDLNLTSIMITHVNNIKLALTGKPEITRADILWEDRHSAMMIRQICFPDLDPDDARPPSMLPRKRR